jgi:hypothetical protein
MEEVPLEKTDKEEEGEPKSGRHKDEREKIAGLQLRTSIHDGVADPTFTDTTGSSEFSRFPDLRFRKPQASLAFCIRK